MPSTQLWFSEQQVALPQHFWFLLQLVLPQQVLPFEATKGWELVVQQVWFWFAAVLPQQVLPLDSDERLGAGGAADLALFSGGVPATYVAFV